ncbi:ABC transporter substrate-binding protein [Roseateles sp.]|uniref:ABC transporter substrate-binding protein n=1 Tax=Roseateles sp. TaxID=1971397 RepID=UPI003D12F120
MPVSMPVFLRRLALSLLFTCGLSEALAAPIAVPGTLRFCAQGSPKSFDPANSDSGIDHAATYPIFDGLIDNEPGTDRLIPALAERWTVAADGRSIRFKLRHGVKFHSTAYFKPTRDFNADDVIFTFARLLDPQHPFSKAHPIVSPYVISAGWKQLIAGVDRIADDEVQIRFHSVDATFLNLLTYAFAGIQSAEYGAQLLKTGKAAQINSLPIGTGPFVYKSYQADSILRYSRHPDFFRSDRAVVEQLVFAITTDRNVRTQRLRRNECDIAALTNQVDLIELERDPAIQIHSVPGLNIGFLAYNTKKPPLDKLAVRQALDMAIDKNTLVKTVFGGAGELANSLVAPPSWAFDASLKAAPYSPEKARELIKSAGVKNLSLTLWAMPVQRFYNPNAQLMAQMIQADWAKVGVTAKIVSYEWGEYLKRVDQGEHDTAMIGWNGEADPASTLGQLSCGAASGSFWCDPAYDALLAKARQTLDVSERKKFYSQAQRMVLAQLPWTPIAHGKIAVAVRQRVQGFKLAPDGNYRFDGVTIKP